MREPRGRSLAAAVGAVWLALSLAGCAATGTDRSTTSTGSSPVAGSGVPPSPAPNVTAGSAVSTYRSTRSHDAVSEPTRLRIPPIDVDTPLELLRRAADQSIEVPRHPDFAGWWAEGVRPGQPGPAVLLGHFDSKDGPAVFFRLGELRPGDEVLVERKDGSTVRFVVTAQHQYQKEQFPSELVYYPTLKSELRLVTCGGSINPTTGHYRDNLVVFATHAP